MTIKQTIQAECSTKVLDHLGLVSGMCEELKISKLIDAHLPNDSVDKILSTGTGVVGLILNGLGFVNKRLYLVSRFFENKPVDKLLNVSYLKAEHFNDDALGRTLDAIYDFGVSELYAIISSSVIRHLTTTYGLKMETGQLDNTNFHLHGKAKELKDDSGTTTFEITHGYSKDHRPDLVQIGLQLIVENQSGIPLLMKVLSGNAEESQSYGDFVKEYANQLKNDYSVDFLVVDSKLYNLDNLEILGGKESLGWLTRVPNGLKVAKEAITGLDADALQPLPGYEKYKYTEVCNTYGDVNQRWVILQSEDKYARDLKNLDKKVIKARLAEQKSYKRLSKELFETQEKAGAAAEKFSKKLKFSSLENSTISVIKGYKKAGKPKKGQLPDKISYKIEGEMQPCQVHYEAEKQRAGYFILATNEMDAQKFDATELLKRYKNQSKVERSFRFLKDPNVVSSSMFVQKPERMTAILMIMSLCLLVYAALEFVTRTLLKKNNTTYENQVGKQIQNPTMKWIFACFEGVHVLQFPDNEKVVINLKDRHRVIINLLGKNYLKYYT